MYGVVDSVFFSFFGTQKSILKRFGVLSITFEANAIGHRRDIVLQRMCDYFVRVRVVSFDEVKNLARKS